MKVYLGILVLVGLLKIGSTEGQCFWKSRIVSGDISVPGNRGWGDSYSFLYDYQLKFSDLNDDKAPAVHTEATAPLTIPYGLKYPLKVTIGADDVANVLTINLKSGADFELTLQDVPPLSVKATLRCHGQNTPLADVELDARMNDFVFELTKPNDQYTFTLSYNDGAESATIAVTDEPCATFLDSASEIIIEKSEGDNNDHPFSVAVGGDVPDAEAEMIAIYLQRDGDSPLFLQDAVPVAVDQLPSMLSSDTGDKAWALTRSTTCSAADVDVTQLSMEDPTTADDPTTVCAYGTREPSTECIYPVADATTEVSSCFEDSELCCVKDDSCRPSMLKRCNTFNGRQGGWAAIIDAPNTEIRINDVKVFDSDKHNSEYEYLYLGETIKKTCKDPAKVLTSVDGVTYSEDKKTASFQCLLFDVNGVEKVTDPLATLEALDCEGYCEKLADVSVDANIVITPDVTVAGNQKVVPGVQIEIACKDGFGRPEDGTLTFQSQDCQTGLNLNTDDFKCYQCALSTEDQNSAVLSSFDQTTVLPEQEITNTCNEGYSYVGYTEEADRVSFVISCTGNGQLGTYTQDNFKCAMDCPIVAEDGNMDQYTLKMTSSEGTKMTIKSVPVNKQYYVECNNDVTQYGELQYGEDDTLVCGEAPTDKTLKPCKPTCSLDTLHSTYNWNKVKVGDDDSSDEISPEAATVRYGATVAFASCPSDKALEYSSVSQISTLTCDDNGYDFANNEFKGVIPQCYDECVFDFGGTYDSAGAEVKVGEDTMDLTNSLRVAKGVEVKLTCKEEDFTVTDMNVNSVTVTCNDGATSYDYDGTVTKSTLSDCAQGCQTQTLLDVHDPTNAKLVEKDDIDVDIGTLMGTYQNANIVCISDDYFMISSSVDMATSKAGYLECKDTHIFGYKAASGVAHALDSYNLQYDCVGKPSIGADASSANGEMGSTLAITLLDGREVPADVSVVVKSLGDAPIDVCTLPDNPADITNTLSCTYQLTDPLDEAQINEILKNGLAVQLSVDVMVYVDPATDTETYTVTKTDDASASLKGTMYFGPRAIDAAKLSTAGVGINQLTITHADAGTLVNDLNEHATNDNLFVLMELYPTADESNRQTIRTKDNPYLWVNPVVLDLASLTLDSATSYTIGMTTSTDKGAGGSSTIAFTTGYKAPSLTSSSITSTDRTLRVILDPAAGATAEVKIAYREDPSGSPVENTESLDVTTAADGSKYVEKTYNSLTAETTYIFDVCHFNAATPSEKGTITVTQGPTEYVVEEDAKNLWVLGDDTVGITLTPEDGVTYYIKVYLGTDTNVAPVFEYVYPEPITNRRKRNGDEAITFTGLEGNTDYTVTFQTEKEIGGTTYTSDVVSTTFKTSACSLAKLKESYPTVKTENGDDVTTAYFIPDENIVYVVTCAEGNRLKQTDLGAVDDKTSCAADGWSVASECEVIPVAPKPVDDSGLSGGAIAGIAIAAVVVLVLLVLLIVCLVKPKKKKSKKKRTTESASKSYKPREKEQDAENPEAPVDNVYDNPDEPDIPANGDQSMGSQEVKMEMKEDEVADPADVVITNDAVVDAVDAV